MSWDASGGPGAMDSTAVTFATWTSGSPIGLKCTDLVDSTRSLDAEPIPKLGKMTLSTAKKVFWPLCDFRRHRRCYAVLVSWLSQVFVLLEKLEGHILAQGLTLEKIMVVLRLVLIAHIYF